jgi:hypothetical protein
VQDVRLLWQNKPDLVALCQILPVYSWLIILCRKYTT